MTIKARKLSYDPECGDLASSFLADQEGTRDLSAEEFDALKADLAQDIQQAIEDWFQGRGVCETCGAYAELVLADGEYHVCAKCQRVKQ